MVRGRLPVLFVVALAAGGARGAPPDPGVPAKGEATVTLLGGLRTVPMGGFLDDQTKAGYRPWKTLFSPGFLLGLGYAADADFHLGLELGHGLHKIQMTPGALQTRSFTILLFADTPLFRRSWVSFYVGGGLGYSLNTLSQNGNDVEANSSAGFVKAGLRFPIAPRFALVIEERYTLASAALPGANGPLVYSGLEGSLNVGGNLVSIGLQFHYMDTEEKGRPYRP
jgi:Outer membrane protein beta-barrel domain